MNQLNHRIDTTSFLSAFNYTRSSSTVQDAYCVQPGSLTECGRKLLARQNPCIRVSRSVSLCTEEGNDGRQSISAITWITTIRWLSARLHRCTGWPACVRPAPVAFSACQDRTWAGRLTKIFEPDPDAWVLVKLS